MRRLRRFTLCLLSVALTLLPLAGCRSHRTDLLEAELRTLEQDLYHLRSELHRSEACNDALQRELGAVRKGVLVSPLPEQASQTLSLRQIALGRGTGGHDDDDCPGDEGIQIVVEPRDQDNHTIKAPGTLYVQALEITPEGLKQPVSAWEVTPDQLRRKWQSGLLSTGYRVTLPWQSWPCNEKVRVVARFILADGRTFEAEKDITIRPTSPARRKALPPPEPGIPLPPRKPDPEESLPPPRKVEPSPGPDLHSASKQAWTNPQWKNPPPPDDAGIWQPNKPPPIHTAIQLLPPVRLGIAPASFSNPTR